jgi:hypothetical protein
MLGFYKRYWWAFVGEKVGIGGRKGGQLQDSVMLAHAALAREKNYCFPISVAFHQSVKQFTRIDVPAFFIERVLAQTTIACLN